MCVTGHTVQRSKVGNNTPTPTKTWMKEAVEPVEYKLGQGLEGLKSREHGFCCCLCLPNLYCSLLIPVFYDVNQLEGEAINLQDQHLQLPRNLMEQHHL